MLLVHARGNHEIGIGNLARCFELIKFLSYRYDIMGIFECDEILFGRFSHKNIIRSDGLKNSLQIIKCKKPEFYICDLIDADKALSDIIKSYGVKNIVYFNGLGLGFEPDILVVMDGFNYIISNVKCKIYRGFEYYILSQDILRNRPLQPKRKKNIKNILISFGGADPAYYTEYFANIISDTTYVYTIVLGPAMNSERKESIMRIKKPNITYIDSPLNLIDLLLQSDMLITLGGMSTYEAMCLGVPVSGIRWNYLSYAVENFGKKGMISDLGDIDSAYQNLLNLKPIEVNKICKRAYDTVDGRSLYNIEKILMFEGESANA